MQPLRTAPVGPAPSTAPRLPRGAVGLLTEALSAADRRLRPVAWLRAVHLAWVLGALDQRRARIVAVHDGGRLVGVAVTLRYDARPAPRRLLPLALHAFTAGLALEFVAQVLLGPGVVVATAVLGVAAAVGAFVLDGRDGLQGAREARRRAAAIGRDHSWGRGVVAVAAGHRGRGLGTALTTALVAELPAGDHWLPVAMTPQAARLYARLGAEPLAGAAADLVARPQLRAVPTGPTAPAAEFTAAA